MKKYLLFYILLLSYSSSLKSQITSWVYDFDNPYELWRFSFDTISNNNCNWQIGKPQKSIFQSAYSNPNVIITDTINAVSKNDTSIFYMTHIRGILPAHVFRLSFWYKMDGDSTDTGKIEISPNNGKNWVNILTEDTTYQMSWQNTKPNLFSSTNGWDYFSVDMTVWASSDSINNPNLPLYFDSDTVLFRFTYSTDSDTVPKDGWMIDNIEVEDYIEGIEVFITDKNVSIFPNPASNKLYINNKNNFTLNKVEIIDINGKTCYRENNLINSYIDINLLQDGIYFLRINNSNSQKFIINRF
jgi:hypothetical protein